MKKKILAVVLIVALIATLSATFVGCKKAETVTKFAGFEPIAKDKIKIGMICLHDENSTYDKNFIDALKAAQSILELSNNQVIIATSIPEGDECYQKACELADSGCNIIFADSFGHEEFLLKAAKKYPNVRFCHATGTMAHTELLPNFYNAFASIYEGRYLAGIVAGMKLNAMIANGDFNASAAKMGYVGAYTYAEVMSGYTAFYLGAKSVCPTVTMDVTFTGSWYDETAENQAATALINNGCKLISQHADSMGAPNACKDAGVPNVTYNISTQEACPNSYLCGSKIDWTPYFLHIVNCAENGVTALGFDWCGGLREGSVVFIDFNSSIAAEGTAEAIARAKDNLKTGADHVFDIDKDNYITVGGQKVKSFKADVDSDAAMTPDTQVIVGTYFAESEYRSAPYFTLEIDGINLLNRKY